MNTPKLQSKVSRVLKPETVLLANKCPTVNWLGMEILERWAMNQPDELMSLEKNQLQLLIRLLEQQEMEQAVLDRPESLTLLSEGLTRHEILTQHEVSMSL